MPTSVYFSGGLRLEVSASIDEVRGQMVGDAPVIQLQTEHGRKVYARRDLVAYIEERPERPDPDRHRDRIKTESPANPSAQG
jgi:hypothetical protein